MKVLKIILASLLGAVAINSVMADEYDGPRNRCKAQSDKVWVERDKRCIPVFPCTEYNRHRQWELYDAYCKTSIFYDKNKEKSEQITYVEDVIKEYYKLRNLSVAEFKHDDFASLTWICAHTSDGGYGCFGAQPITGYIRGINVCDRLAIYKMEAVYTDYYSQYYICDEHECKRMSGQELTAADYCMGLYDVEESVCTNMVKMADSPNHTCTSQMEKTQFADQPLCRITCKS